MNKVRKEIIKKFLKASVVDRDLALVRSLLETHGANLLFASDGNCAITCLGTIVLAGERESASIAREYLPSYDIYISALMDDFSAVSEIVDKNPWIIHARSPSVACRSLFEIASISKEMFDHLVCLGGEPPLGALIRTERESAIRDRLKRKPWEINIASTLGLSPLQEALESGNDNMLRVILEYEPDPLHINPFNRSGVLHYITKATPISVVEQFLKCGVDFTSINTAGLSPAKLAALLGRVDVLKLFFKHGVKLEIDELFGKQLQQLGNSDVIDFLRMVQS